jgi:hypothetical protein
VWKRQAEGIVVDQNSLEALLGALIYTTHTSLDIQICDRWERRQVNHRNPLCRFGKKIYSQSDEDGLTLEIVRRLGLTQGTFLEMGVGDGTENNTLVLLAMGWRGHWLGDEPIIPRFGPETRLGYTRGWVDLDSLPIYLEMALKRLGTREPDLISMDLDGNDYHLVKLCLESGLLPQVFIVEYNGAFPPPLDFCMPYDAQHSVGENSNFYGCSITRYWDLFRKYGYFLACCNAATGVNAFFVRDTHRPLFPEVPEDLKDLYAERDVFLRKRLGAFGDKKTLDHIVG